MKYYAYSKKIDAITGDVVFDPATNTRAEQQPVAAIIAAELTTPLGTAAHDRTRGIDLSQLENARDNAPAIAENAIRRALAKYVPSVFTILSVEVEVRETDEALIYAIEVRDPRGDSETIRGNL